MCFYMYMYVHLHVHVHAVDKCLYMYIYVQVYVHSTCPVHTVDLYNVLMYMCYNNNVCDNYMYYYTLFIHSNILFLRVKGMYSLPDEFSTGHSYTVATPTPRNTVSYYHFEYIPSIIIHSFIHV